MKLLLLPLILCVASAFADDLKIGVIGMDTSHVTAFTKLLNDATAPDHVPGGKVVAAFIYSPSASLAMMLRWISFEPP